MQIMKKHIRAGRVEEIILSPGYTGPVKRQPRIRVSSKEKKKQNLIAAVHVLARIINTNFDQEDVLLTLTYNDAGLEHLHSSDDKADAAEQRAAQYRLARSDLDQYIERCLYHAEKQGATVKYVAVTSDMDGETQQTVRLHHHLIVNADALQIMWDNWHYGYIDASPMDDGPDYMALAYYLLKQVHTEKDKKKYKRSKNLKMADVETEPYDGSPIQIPVKAKLTDAVGYYYRYHYPTKE